jgi:hypothetical protein
MRKRIEDEFTNLRTSRQRKYQLRMLRDKRCTECGEPAVQGSRCLKHLIKARERQRKKRGLKRRYYNTLSYRLQELEKSAAKAPARKSPRTAVRARPKAAVRSNARKGRR